MRNCTPRRWLFLVSCVVGIASSVCVAQATYSITGKVVNAASGSPLPRASVSLEEAKDGSLFASVTTDENGNFQFLRLPADKYVLRGSHRGYITTAYDAHDNFTTALVTGEGMNCCANLQLRLLPGGVIAGTVAEDSGDPVENGVVVLYRENNRTGSERVQRVRTTNVDESGAYEFAGLEPGNYFVSASAQPWYANRARMMRMNRNANGSENDTPRSPLDVVYATDFYPDTTDEKEAAPVPIKGGEHLIINFSLHPVPALHLTIQMPPTTESGRNSFFVPVIEQQVFGTTERVFGSAMMGRQGGVLEVSVPPGQYELRTPERDGGPGKSISFDASTDQAVDLNAGSTLADVSGKLAFASGGALPDNLFVSFTTLEGQNNNGGARLEKDGSFTIHGVTPGVYRLNVVGGGKRFHISRMVASGAQIGHRQITIGSGPVTLAANIYADLGLSVSGFARNDGVIAPGAMVVLVPADPVRDRDYFRRTQSDSDGSFVLKNVEPGRYTVIAIQDGWSLDWARPEVVQHYAQLGQPVVASENSPQIIQLKEAVDVQAK